MTDVHIDHESSASITAKLEVNIWSYYSLLLLELDDPQRYLGFKVGGYVTLLVEDQGIQETKKLRIQGKGQSRNGESWQYYTLPLVSLFKQVDFFSENSC